MIQQSRELAIFSDDRKYRYLLMRDLAGMLKYGKQNVITFLMLNPSTADEHKNDATINRCMDYSRRWGNTTMFVVNLSPLRSTDPQRLKEAGPEPAEVFETNQHYILKAAKESDCLVLAYGVWGDWEGRSTKTLAMLADAGIKPWCLGLTKEGYPLHPVRLAKSLELQPYPIGN